VSLATERLDAAIASLRREVIDLRRDLDEALRRIEQLAPGAFRPTLPTRVEEDDDGG